METKTLAILFSIVILILVIEMIRRQKMTFKYSMFWLAACVIVLFAAIYDGLIAKIAHFVGFALVSNFVFFTATIFFIILTLLLTLYVNEQNNRSETLAQAVGILECKIKKLESDLSDQQKQKRTQ